MLFKQIKIALGISTHPEFLLFCIPPIFSLCRTAEVLSAYVPTNKTGTNYEQ